MADAIRIDRQTTTPFLLRLFYKNGAFHRLEDFASTRLPPHLQIYTWQSCTLSELTHLLLTALPSLLPAQYAGTRICFRLIYPDMQGPSRPGMAPRFIARELGSVIVGAVSVDAEGRPTDAEADDVDMRDQEQDQDQDVKEEEGKPSGQEDVKDALKQLSGELNKTLHDARFVIGDYISAAILPPLADGSVASPPPPPAARGPPPPRDGYRPRENGFGGRGGSGGGEWDRYGPGREGRGGRGGRFEDRGAAFPAGEWRRGEAPPERERDRDAYWSRGGGGRGGGRGRGRW